MASTVGLSKVFILDKYFHELQKFWETEKRLKDTSCDNEAEKLQQRLRSLSTELVTLRSRLQVSTGGEPMLPQHGGTPDDLIHLAGPLTEDAIVRTMQARFYAREYFIHAGPVLFFSNPYQDLGNPLTLAKAGSKCQPLLKVVQEAVKLQSETGFPQSLVVTGASGSGKTYTSMLLLRQLFDVAGGGPETDAFKHLSAAFTVLRSLGSASTISNSESSRVGQFIEVQVSDGHLYRTKIHCYFLDQDRIIRPLPNEKNYHIFYQMLAGLSREERIQLHLENYTIHKLSYLNKGSCHQNEGQDFARFETWKSCLSVLGIPFQDVMRVLAAVLLLGNIQFVDGKSEVEIKGSELKSVGQLLSINSRHLQMGLTCRTRYIRGQSVKSKVDAQTASWTRDCLAKALYCRTFATIVRRANSLKRVGSSTLSSVSTESAQHHLDAISQHASTVDSSGIRSCKSMSVLNSAVRHATDGYIGIVDMFGFENIQVNKLEQLCINLCAETLQHFYNTHVFKSNIETCKEEAVVSESPVDYVDNVPCIDLISSLKSGLLNILDNECSVNGTPESYSQKVKQQHQNNPRWFECSDPRKFGVRHFHSNVVYDTTDFLDTNRDIIPDDVVCVFQKNICQFGFAMHLFGTEIKLFCSESGPKGVNFRISPTVTDSEGKVLRTLTHDFHGRLDSLLRTLVHAKPHFIRCIKPNNHEQPGQFDRQTFVQQIRALQVLETVNLMASGFPHRMRFKAFSSRYRLLAPWGSLKRQEDTIVEDCKTILKWYNKKAGEMCKFTYASTDWALGKRHIFLSEATRQQLEMLRSDRRHEAATLIQALWKGWRLRKQIHFTRPLKSQQMKTRPRAISVTPDLEKCDQKTIQQTCTLFGLDLEHPPPLPPSRSYTVSGNTKLGYPQTRIMKMNYPEDGSSEFTLKKGEAVMVVGASAHRGHLLVEHKNHTIHIPYQFLELTPQDGLM